MKNIRFSLPRSAQLKPVQLKYIPIFSAVCIGLSFSAGSLADNHNSVNLVCGKSEYNISEITGNTSFKTTARLNVRTGPSKECRIIEVLPNAQAVTKLKRIQTPEREWAYITWFEEGVDKVGWASGKFLTGVDTAQTVIETPVVETPVVETPIVEAPVVETPVVETPVVETPVVETPVVETPIVETPVVETPVVETPVVETPVVETPVVETPVVETPVVETPVVETPVLETPVVESPVVKSPLAASQGNTLEDISQWKGVLDKMKRAHEQGNANRLSNLYTINGRENSLVGADTILVYYAAEFRKTADRSVTFEPSSYRAGFTPGENSAIIEGKMISDQIIIELGRRTEVTASFRMVLVKENETYRVQSLDTEPLWR